MMPKHSRDARDSSQNIRGNIYQRREITSGLSKAIQDASLLLKELKERPPQQLSRTRHLQHDLNNGRFPQSRNTERVIHGRPLPRISNLQHEYEEESVSMYRKGMDEYDEKRKPMLSDNFSQQHKSLSSQQQIESQDQEHQDFPGFPGYENRQARPIFLRTRRTLDQNYRNQQQQSSKRNTPENTNYHDQKNYSQEEFAKVGRVHSGEGQFPKDSSQFRDFSHHNNTSIHTESHFPPERHLGADRGNRNVNIYPVQHNLPGERILPLEESQLLHTENMLPARRLVYTVNEGHPLDGDYPHERGYGHDYYPDKRCKSEQDPRVYESFPGDESHTSFSKIDLEEGSRYDTNLSYQPSVGRDDLPPKVHHCLTTAPVIETMFGSLFPPMEHEKPQAIKQRPKGCKTVFIGELPFVTNEKVVEQLFGSCGTIKKTVINISKVNQNIKYCHLKFELCDAADAAISFAGHYIFVGAPGAPLVPDLISKICVDYALDRYDQLEYENEVKQLEDKSLNPETFSESTFDNIVRTIHNMDKFHVATALLGTWCEKGRCTKTYVNKFYYAISAVHSQIKKITQMAQSYGRLVKEHKQEEEPKELNIKEKCEAVKLVFAKYRIQKVWDSFTKGQRKNIQQFEENFKKELQEIEKSLNLRLHDIGERQEQEKGEIERQSQPFDDDMDIEEEGAQDSTVIRVEQDQLTLEQENAQLKTQVTALRAAAEKNSGLMIELEKLRREHELYTVETKSTLLEKDDRILRLEATLQSLYQYTCYGYGGNWQENSSKTGIKNPEDVVDDFLAVQKKSYRVNMMRSRSTSSEKESVVAKIDRKLEAETEAMTEETASNAEMNAEADEVSGSAPKRVRKGDDAPDESDYSEANETLNEKKPFLEDLELDAVDLSERELTCIPIFSMLMCTCRNGVTADDLSAHCFANDVIMTKEEINSLLEKVPAVFSCQPGDPEDKWFFAGLTHFK